MEDINQTVHKVSSSTNADNDNRQQTIYYCIGSLRLSSDELIVLDLGE